MFSSSLWTSSHANAINKNNWTICPLDLELEKFLDQLAMVDMKHQSGSDMPLAMPINQIEFYAIPWSNGLVWP